MLRAALLAGLLATTSGCAELGSALDMRLSPIGNVSPSWSSSSSSSNATSSAQSGGGSNAGLVFGAVPLLLIGVPFLVYGIETAEQPHETGGAIAFTTLGGVLDVGAIAMIVAGLSGI